MVVLPRGQIMATSNGWGTERPVSPAAGWGTEAPAVSR